MELLFLIGIAWAASRAIEALRKPAAARWAKYQKARAGTTPAQRAKARAARATVAGYWAGEISRGLPHARHGWAKGWGEHRASRAEIERDHARVAADYENRIARVRAEMAAHRHRLQVARERNARPPTMTEQLETERQNGDHLMRSQDCTDPDCSCHAGDLPLAGGSTPANGNSKAGSPPAQKITGEKMTDTNGSGGDFNYDSTVQLCDELTAAAEEAANDPSFEKAQALADALGGMLNNDSGALSKAADVARDAQAGKDAARQLMEDAQAMKDHIVSNYGPVQEAVDASEGTAPQPEFVDH